MNRLTPPADRPFAVVHTVFEDYRNGEPCATIAACNWLSNICPTVNSEGKTQTKATLYWPNVEDSEMRDLLMDNTKPDRSNKNIWAEKKCTVLKFCKTYGSAKDGVDEAEVASELDTDGPVLTFKRVAKPIRRYNPDSDDDDDGQIDKRNQVSTKKGTRAVDQRPAPQKNDRPDVKKLKLNQSSDNRDAPQNRKDIQKIQASSSTSSEPSSRSPAPIREADAELPLQSPRSSQQGMPSSDSAIDNSNNEMSKTTSSAPTNDEVIAVNESIDTNSNQLLSGGNKDNHQKRPLIVSCKKRYSPRKLNFSGASGGLSSLSLARELAIIQEKVDDQSIKINAIYMAVCPVLVGEGGGEEADKIIPPLPLATKEAVMKFEEFVEKKEHKVAIVHLLADYGTNNLRTTVYSIMKKLFSNELASEYNLDGINRGEVVSPKRGLKSSPMHKIVLAATKRRAAKLKDRIDLKYNAVDCNKHMANWLKAAPKRFSNEKNRKEKSNHDEDVEEEDDF